MTEDQKTNPERDFEHEVASIFQALGPGATVELNAPLAGHEIDVVVREIAASGKSATTIVECKRSKWAVDINVVASIASLFDLLKARGEADAAIIVAKGGFTHNAREYGRRCGVELLEMEELRRRVSGRADLMESAVRQVQAEDERRAHAGRPTRIFVAIPFSKEFNDIYLLGIRDVAERLGYVVERGDEVEHNGYIVDVITDRLRSCDVVIADTTTENANVFYEVGYGHALNVPTVLICREGKKPPFDVQSINHIIYDSIVDLRDKLERRLKFMLKDNRRSTR